MRLHANAALSLKGRRELCRRVVEDERMLTEAAEAAGVSVRCVRKWVARYRAGGELGLLDRSSAPRSIPHRTSEQRVQAIAALRRLRFTGPEIAETLGMALSTVSGVLTRLGMGKLGRLGLEPALRYERERPGELIHIDVKKLGKIKGGAGKQARSGVRRNRRIRRRDSDGVPRNVIGWDYVHIAVDDCTRMAYAKSSRTRGRSPSWRSSGGPWRSSWSTASPLSSSSPTTARGTAPPSTQSPAARSGSGTSEPAPTDPDQRQGRTVHPHPPGRLGLRRSLRHQPPTHRRSRRLAVVLQPPTKTLSPRPQAPGRSPQRANQPPRDLHLGHVH